MAPKKTWQDFLGQAQKRMEASKAKLPPGASEMRMAAPTYPKGPISVDTALELAEQHLGGAPTKTVTSGSGGVQFIREVVDPVSGKKITKIARFDINPASPHVGKLGPHLNLETQINGETVTSGLQADPHIPIDPTTIRPGDY